MTRTRVKKKWHLVWVRPALLAPGWCEQDRTYHPGTGQLKASLPLPSPRMNSQVTGPVQWAILHRMAQQLEAIKTDDSIHLLGYYEYLRTLTKVFPCKICRENLAQHLQKYTLASMRRLGPVAFINDLQNQVNAALGKPTLLLRVFRTRLRVWPPVADAQTVYTWLAMLAVNQAVQDDANQIEVFQHLRLLGYLGSLSGLLPGDLSELQLEDAGSPAQLVRYAGRVSGWGPTRVEGLGLAAALEPEKNRARMQRPLSGTPPRDMASQ